MKMTTIMQWNKPLSEIETASFRQCVIAAIPSKQQANMAEQLKNILLTDKRINHLISAINQQAVAGIPTNTKRWHDEDIQGCVTPELLARDWLAAKNNHPHLWQLIARLRYPADLREQKDLTTVGIRLYNVWEQKSIKYPSRVRAWLYNIKVLAVPQLLSQSKVKA